MKIKRGVSLRGVQWQMWLAALVVDRVYQTLGYGEVVITSGSEGEHRHDTHADGYALDFRNRDVPPAKRQELCIRCQESLDRELGPGYQFVVETNPDHNHCEYDPRVTIGAVA